MLPNMRNVAAVIADDAREQGGVDVQQATPRLAREKLTEQGHISNCQASGVGRLGRCSSRLRIKK
jgi:hypothetical protein